MNVQIKLMAALRSKLPPDAKAGSVQLELEPNATVRSALAQLGIEADQIHLVMLNGQQEPNRDRELNDGDEIVAFPPVSGG